MILLDSHVAVWLANTPERISPAANQALRNAASAGEAIALPAASIFEIATEIRKGRIRLLVSADTYFEEMTARLKVIPVSGEIARVAGELPKPFHGDPLDRMVVATAIVANATLITADKLIRESRLCETLW